MKTHANPGVMIHQDKDPKPGDRLEDIYCGLATYPPQLRTIVNIKNAKTNWKGEGVVISRDTRLHTYVVAVRGRHES